MKTINNEKLYLYCSFSSSYGTLHGMYDGGLATCCLRDVKEIARAAAVDIINGYDCLIEPIIEDAMAEYDYDYEPEEPCEAYLDYIEDRIQEEAEYLIFEVTEAGRAHAEEMENDPSNYENYKEEGWVVPCSC